MCPVSYYVWCVVISGLSLSLSGSIVVLLMVFSRYWWYFRFNPPGMYYSDLLVTILTPRIQYILFHLSQEWDVGWCFLNSSSISKWRNWQRLRFLLNLPLLSLGPSSQLRLFLVRHPSPTTPSQPVYLMVHCSCYSCSPSLFWVWPCCSPSGHV